MYFPKIVMTFIVTAVAVVPGMLAQTTTLTTNTRNFTVGPLGVGSTETIQVNVANLAGNSSSGTAASCTGSVTFNNASGTAIGTASTFTVTSGQISSVSLPFNKIASSGVRAEVIGVIAMTPSSSSSTPQGPCQLHYSVETFDTSTGATHSYVSGDVAAGVGGFGPGR